MAHLSRKDLMTLEGYAEARPEYRQQVMEHKKDRRILIGPSVMMHFEDRLTIQYQIQEMLRVERIFDAPGINEELESYNPMLPDGSNWKATMMIEFPDAEERAVHLAKMIGIERMTWVQVGELEQVTAISDEDLERENDVKTSSVHFMRFELTPEMKAAAQAGAQIQMGIDLPYYLQKMTLTEAQRSSLVNDLE